MSRFLFVVPPLAGHVAPTVAVGAELARRGHQTAWSGHEGTLRAQLEPGARVFEAVDPAAEGDLRAAQAQWLALRGPAALRFFWERFVLPLGHAMAPPVRDAVAAFAPDVVVADQQALAGGLAAREAQLPWVTSATTSGELTRPLAALPKLEAWVSDQIAGFQRAWGVTDPVDLRFSERLVLVFSTPGLMGACERYPAQCAFTGPALCPRPGEGPFPWERLDPERRRVLVSLGTLNAGAGGRFFTTAVEAVADLGERLQVIVVAPPGALPRCPAHVLSAERVPQLDLLRHLDAVVTHGGHNTVCEALFHGLPLVVAPIRDDQPIVADQVVRAGAGLRIRFGRVTIRELRGALLAVLDDPGYRAGARRVQASFQAAGGAAAAADRLEEVA